jgi:dienelactone hydrolase
VRNTGPLPAEAMASLVLHQRDFAKAHPASDDVFRIYRNLYAYDRTPLHASTETLHDSSDKWTKEKVTFDAAYGNTRMSAFLFLPKNTRPPFQAVVFFPSARVNFLSSSESLGDLTFMDYVVDSGRAVVYPIYAGLYERRAARPTLPGPALVRETTIEWSKDLGRTIDYLETRPDIDKSRGGYLGVSQGSAYGVIFAALEDRLKAVVLLDGGYFQQQNPTAGLDQVDFAPRVTRPVLMINGRYDATFPLQSAQEPLFRMLGTPAADKRHVVFDTTHDVRQQRSTLVHEVLAWYDKYLGRVN